MTALCCKRRYAQDQLPPRERRERVQRSTQGDLNSKPQDDTFAYRRSEVAPQVTDFIDGLPALPPEQKILENTKIYEKAPPGAFLNLLFRGTSGEQDSTP